VRIRHDPSPVPSRRPRLADFLHLRRDDLLAAWKDSAPQRGHVLDLVDRVVARVAELETAGASSPPPVHQVDAIVRIDELVADGALLRGAATRLLEHDEELISRRAVRILDQAIDDVIAASVDHYLRDLHSTAEKTAAELRFLADATLMLSSSLNYDETLEQVARLAVPVLADWCVVDLLEQGGVRRVSVAHRDPGTSELAREWARKYPTDLDPSRGVAQVIHTGTPELVSKIPDELLVEAALDAEHLGVLRTLGLTSYLIVPLTARGRTLGAITLVTAGSGRRYGTADVGLATELARRAALAVDNARLYHEAHEAVRARDQLLAIVSHDLRNPLGAIGIMVSVLREIHTADPMPEQLDIIQRSVERMKRLIGDLVDTSSIQAGRLALVRESTEAGRLVAEAVDSYAALAAKKGIALSVESVGGVRVLCDPGRIAQVLGNLLANAIKFSRSGDTISLRVSLDGDRARFVVADTGPGIPKQDLPHVFEPYWSAIRYAKQGTGLGLYISKGIIETHGGSMWANSEPGKGTNILFTLPLPDHTESL